MLQRFRQNKDFNQPDRSKPKSKKVTYNNNTTGNDKENKWWIGNGQQTEQEKKQTVEKERYLKALKALVKEKGEKFDIGGEIPNLCSCGALGDNILSMKKGQSKELVNMCASNC